MMKINLMLPTRNRVEKCYTFCKSALETCSDPNNFFISIVTDKDDDTVPELKEKLKDFQSIKYLKQEDVSGFLGLTYYWNKIIEQTKDETDIFAMVGDDMIFRDKGWDAIVIDIFNKLQDKIALVHFNSGAPQGSNLCINSFVHKRYIEITGMYVDSRLKGDYADDFLYKTFKALGRLYYVRNVKIEHVHPDYGKCERDDTAVRRRSVDGHQYEGMSLSKFFTSRIIPVINNNINILRQNMV